MTPDAILTEIFSVPPSSYIGRILSFWLSKWGWVLIIPFAICGALSFYRWEWIIVALILLLIIYPFILALLYFTHGLTEEGINATRSQLIQISSTGITVEYMSHVKDADEFDSLFNVSYGFGDIKCCSITNKGLLIRLKKKYYCHLFIPEETYQDRKEDLIALLRENGIPFV